MALFRHHPIRSAGYALGLVIVAHFLHRFIPDTHFAFSLTSTSIAILAISSLAILIVAHHTREGQIMTQTQEEMLLIGAFGLFWISFLIILRAFRTGTAQTEPVVATATTALSAVKASTTRTGSKRPPWCSEENSFCVLEEWKYNYYY